MVVKDYDVIDSERISFYDNDNEYFSFNRMRVSPAATIDEKSIRMPNGFRYLF
jgi:hypothetical protein